MKLIHRTSFLLPLLAFLAAAETPFRLESVEETVKLQRPPKRTWVSMKGDEQILNDDIIETYFKARAIVGFGESSVIVLGSNSKALFNAKQVEREEGRGWELNITLFFGGVLIRNADEAHVKIFTANGVAAFDSASVSGVVEAKTGHTGFQILGGRASVRNVAQQEGKTLGAGQTTIILPAREPTVPLHMTLRHVSVLKSFFGDKFVDEEMQASGIQATSDQAMSRATVSRTQRKAAVPPELMSYKPLFSLNRIYGIIVEEQQKFGRSYFPILPPSPVPENGGELRLGGGGALAAGSYSPRLSLGASYSREMAGLGLRLPMVGGPDGLSLHMESAPGLLDKVDFLRVGSMSSNRYLYLGRIEELSMGSGLVVRSFNNRNPYASVQPLGAIGEFAYDPFVFGAFLADVHYPKIGGAVALVEASSTRLGAGYYMDMNQYEYQPEPSYARFVDMGMQETESVPDPDSVTAHAHIYELMLEANVVNDLLFSMDFSFAFAQKIKDQGVDGFAVSGPTITVGFSMLRIGAGLDIEGGRLVQGQFGPNYLSNRFRRYVEDGQAYYFTQNNVLSKHRTANGAHVILGVTPVRGLTFDLFYKGDFKTENAFSDSVFAQGVSFTKNNFDYEAGIALDDQLVPRLKYGRAYVRQLNGGYYPATAGLFASWGAEAGMEFTTAPLFRNLSLEGKFRFIYVDFDTHTGDPQNRFNNNIDPNDTMISFYLGTRMDFLNEFTY